MKTKNKLGLLFIISVVLTGCNIGGGDIPTYVYDLRYKNKTARDINIITFYKGELIDNLKIKKKSICYFSNIELREETLAKNSVFKLNSGTYSKDSILVVSNDILVDTNNNKYKKYIFINNEYREFENGYKYGAQLAFNLYSYYNKTVKRRAVLALNKGAL